MLIDKHSPCITHVVTRSRATIHLLSIRTNTNIVKVDQPQTAVSISAPHSGSGAITSHSLNQTQPNPTCHPLFDHSQSSQPPDTNTLLLCVENRFPAEQRQHLAPSNIPRNKLPPPSGTFQLRCAEGSEPFRSPALTSGLGLHVHAHGANHPSSPTALSSSHPRPVLVYRIRHLTPAVPVIQQHKLL